MGIWMRLGRQPPKGDTPCALYRFMVSTRSFCLSFSYFLRSSARFPDSLCLFLADATATGEAAFAPASIDGLLLASAIARRRLGKWNRCNREILVASGRPAHATHVVLGLLGERLDRRALGFVAHVADHLR